MLGAGDPGSIRKTGGPFVKCLQTTTVYDTPQGNRVTTEELICGYAKDEIGAYSDANTSYSNRLKQLLRGGNDLIGTQAMIVNDELAMRLLQRRAEALALADQSHPLPGTGHSFIDRP